MPNRPFFSLLLEKKVDHQTGSKSSCTRASPGNLRRSAPSTKKGKTIALSSLLCSCFSLCPSFFYFLQSRSQYAASPANPFFSLHECCCSASLAVVRKRLLGIHTGWTQSLWHSIASFLLSSVSGLLDLTTRLF